MTTPTTLQQPVLTECLEQTEITSPAEAPTDPGEQADQSDHPWSRFAGMYEENPLFDDVLAFIQAYRRALDEDETVI